MTRPTPIVENHLTNHGKETPLSQHIACQYEWSDSPTNSTVRCMRPAVMMPGYKRACAEHILHVLCDSIQQYLQVPRDTATTEQLYALLNALGHKH